MRTASWTSLLAALLATSAQAVDSAPLLAKVLAVGKQGQGNALAAKAWTDLVKQGPDALPDILYALDKADPTAANWLRSAFEAIADREVGAGRKLPTDKLEAFVKDTKRAGNARRLAYEWLARVEPTTPGRLLPGMLNDPGVELRRDAVARVLTQADALFEEDDKGAARKAYEGLLPSARDRDQVDWIAGQLKKLDVTVDVTAHFGIIRRWLVISPFDNSGGTGFKAVYPPEKQVDLNASYLGKGGLAVSWKEVITPDPYGKMDVNQLLTKYMGAVAYAFAAVESPAERPVEIRVTSKNAIKILLNGKEIFFREEYHHGMRFDGMVGKGVLKAGRNEVLVKVCQNEQKEDWAQEWDFALRLCDAIGGAVPFKLLLETPRK